MLRGVSRKVNGLVFLVPAGGHRSAGRPQGVGKVYGKAMALCREATRSGARGNRGYRRIKVNAGFLGEYGAPPDHQQTRQFGGASDLTATSRLVAPHSAVVRTVSETKNFLSKGL